MKLLIDMNLSPGWVGFLALSGFDSMHWTDAGPPNAADSVIMEFARKNNYVILTHDLDFSGILAASGSKKPSVVQIRSEVLMPERIGKQVVSALRQLESEIEQGALIVIEPDRFRLRILPLM